MQAVTLSWELVQGLSTNAHDFWPALKGFISMAFQHKLLQLTHDQAPILTTALKKVIHTKTKQLFPSRYLPFSMFEFQIYDGVKCFCLDFHRLVGAVSVEERCLRRATSALLSDLAAQ